MPTRSVWRAKVVARRHSGCRTLRCGGLAACFREWALNEKTAHGPKPCDRSRDRCNVAPAYSSSIFARPAYESEGCSNGDLRPIFRQSSEYKFPCSLDSTTRPNFCVSGYPSVPSKRRCYRRALSDGAVKSVSPEASSTRLFGNLSESGNWQTSRATGREFRGAVLGEG